jgi:hypothetical protein
MRQGENKKRPANWLPRSENDSMPLLHTSAISDTNAQFCSSGQSDAEATVIPGSVAIK